MGGGIIGIVLVKTWKALGVGVGLDGAGAGGLHGKLQAWVHGAVQGVLGWGREGALCRAGHTVQVCVGSVQVAAGVGKGALCGGMANDPAGPELHPLSLVQPMGTEGAPTLRWGQPGGERAPTLAPLAWPGQGLPSDPQCWGLALS